MHIYYHLMGGLSTEIQKKFMPMKNLYQNDKRPRARARSFGHICEKRRGVRSPALSYLRHKRSLSDNSGVFEQDLQSHKYQYDPAGEFRLRLVLRAEHVAELDADGA